MSENKRNIDQPDLGTQQPSRGNTQRSGTGTHERNAEQAGRRTDDRGPDRLPSADEVEKQSPDGRTG